MNAITVILQKEWWELRRERSLLATLLLFPALITAIGLGATFALGLAPDDDTAMLGAATADPALAGLPMDQLGQVIMGRQFSLLLLLLPMFLPSLLAAYSIVGEKSRRTLEPLLATPVRDWELLLAKSLGAVIPPLLMTWACAAIFAAGIGLASLTPEVAGLIITPAWALMLAVCSPLLALIAVAASVLISARVNDPRTAQNLSGVLVVPFMALFFGQLVGLVVLNLGFVLAFAAALAALAALTVWLAARLFARETILTRWK
ncbi:MAG TPA: ABC transporter permease subunit [Chloroflexaceae bacterium]|nr:ABC transporter permease subunit [Chloroflexaceae bacterium]